MATEENITLVGSWNPITDDAIGGYSHDVKILRDYAYIADGNKGLQIINIIDPSNPILISSFETFAEAKSLTLQGNYAYVSYYKRPESPEPPISGLEIIDISDETNPFHVGLFNDLSVNGYAPQDLIVNGNYVYAIDGGLRSQVKIIDINDPSSPSVVASFESPTERYIKNLKDITVQGNYLYTTYAWNGVKISNQLTGLEILDISNPTESQLLGGWGGNLADIVVKGNYAYVGYSYIGAYMSPARGGMVILDISDPANPQNLGDYGNGYPTQDLEVIGNYAYLINSQGLEILNVSNPNNISLIDSYEILIDSDEIYGGTKSVSVDREYIYVTASDDNLQIFSHDITNRGNDAPVAKNDSYSTDEDTTLTIKIDEGILQNDTDADANPLNVLIETEPSHGSLTLNSDGSFEYIPDVDFFGEDSFTYKANDGLVNSHHANVTITINPVDDSSNIDNSLDDSSDNSVDNSVDEVVLDDLLFRFQNSDRPGTYLFAGEGESENIRANFPNFVEEGFAFNVSFEQQDDLIRFNRFQNTDKLGTYLYATEGESQSIRDNYPNFIEEGIAFYAYGADANKGVDYYRFQNTQQLGTYIFVGEEEKNNIIANFPQFRLEGVAFEVG